MWYFTSIWHVIQEEKDQFDFGKAFHSVLDVYHSTQKNIDMTFSELNRVTSTLKGSQAELLLSMIPTYITYDLGQTDEDLEIPHVIETHEEPYPSSMFLDKGVLLICKPDLVFRRGRELFVVEHKTSSSYYHLSDVTMNVQGRLYSLIVSDALKDWDKVTVMYNVAYKFTVKEPKVNKDGSISRARIRTTPEIYESVVKREGQDPEDYLGTIAKIHNPIFNERLTTNPKRKEVRVMVEQVIDDMNRHVGHFPYGRMTSFCRSCKYYDICSMCLDDGAKAWDYVNAEKLIERS
jgi:hypothetical protein